MGKSMNGLSRLMKKWEKDVTPGTPDETLETAGCTGGCEYYDSDGLPDCGRCSQCKGKDKE